MKTKRVVLFTAILLLALTVMGFMVQKAHTVTLASGESTEKAEQIRPLWATVTVSGDCDTDVIFTDVETGKRYIVGYITHGVSEKIRLEKGKWFTVKGAGNLTLRPVTVRAA